MTEARAKPPLTTQKINNYVWAPSLQENISPAQRGNYQQFNKPNSEKRERERETRVERETEEGGHQPPAIDSPPFAAVVPPAAHPTSDADLSNPNKYIFSPTKPNTDMIFLWFSFSVLYVYNLCEYVIVEFFFFFCWGWMWIESVTVNLWLCLWVVSVSETDNYFCSELWVKLYYI